MAANLNPQYEQIGKAFVEQYYNIFDNVATRWVNVKWYFLYKIKMTSCRANLQQLYNADQSLLSFEGQQMQGAAKIMEKLGSLTFQKIQHLITTTDCQPMFDGGILINVLGQLKVKLKSDY